MPINTSPTTQDALSVIAARYNLSAAPGMQIGANTHTFSAVSVNTDSNYAKNSLITATPIGSSSTNSIKIYYDRIDLSTVAVGFKLSLEVGSSQTLASQIVPYINGALGINLTPSDYVDYTYSHPTLTIQALPESVLFIGTMQLPIVGGGVTPNVIPLSLEPIEIAWPPSVIANVTPTPVSFDIPRLPFGAISTYNIFVDWTADNPGDGLVPQDVNYQISTGNAGVITGYIDAVAKFDNHESGVVSFYLTRNDIGLSRQDVKVSNTIYMAITYSALQGPTKLLYNLPQ